MDQIVPPTLGPLVKTIPGVLLICPFLPVTSAFRQQGWMFCHNWKDQTDTNVPFVGSENMTHKFHGLLKSAGFIEVLFFFLIHCNCPKECCFTWFLLFYFDTGFFKNLCTLFLTKLCPHWTALSSTAEISILAAASHPAAVAVHILPHSHLCWSHVSSWSGMAKCCFSFFHSNSRITHRWCSFP